MGLGGLSLIIIIQKRKTITSLSPDTCYAVTVKREMQMEIGLMNQGLEDFAL